MCLLSSIDERSLLLSSLVQFRLNTPLQSFALIMLVSRLLLSLTITSDTSDSTAKSAGHTVTDTLSEITQLALSFLTLARLVLLDALLLQSLCSNEAAD